MTGVQTCALPIPMGYKIAGYDVIGCNEIDPPITIHPDVSGRPQGILMHRKLIEYMRSKPGVTFVTYAEACEDFLSKK